MNQGPDPPSTPSPTAPAGTTNKKSDTSQFVEFDVGGQRYAFPIQRIREIVILKSITPTPQVADYVDGVSNLRGTIIPIINLRVLFGLQRRDTDAETRTIVVNVGDKTMGCTVDTVSQVLRIDNADIGEAPETITADGRDYIRGFLKIDDRLVIILDVDALLSVDQLANVRDSNLGKSLNSQSPPNH